MRSLCSCQVSLITGWHLTFDPVEGDHPHACPLISGVLVPEVLRWTQVWLWEQAGEFVVTNSHKPQEEKINLRLNRGHHDVFTRHFIFGKSKDRKTSGCSSCSPPQWTSGDKHFYFPLYHSLHCESLDRSMRTDILYIFPTLPPYFCTHLQTRHSHRHMHDLVGFLTSCFFQGVSENFV